MVPPPARRRRGRDAAPTPPTALPDRTREVAPAPEVDAAVAGMLDLARWAKARRHRGRLTAQESQTVELALRRRTGAFAGAVRRMLQSPVRSRPGAVAAPAPVEDDTAQRRS
ncbi:hypothetical protein [Lapillicoccus jejuensis]|uniref:Uncharacterized protein n=1 Tax=Lapillicoccus jejuensis TaxID=402171 RepID=A0A542E118_9MICO|nr:hypothetical protein [Lapillicoccus jejuensis]TQJ09012.1 hypothetical protein FB458_2115 [Lapillicoccus jejuensis]